MVIVTGRSLDELWCFREDGVMGLQRHACVNLNRVVVGMDGEKDHIPRARFLGRSITLMLSTSVSLSTSIVVMPSEGMDMESMDDYNLKLWQYPTTPAHCTQALPGSPI